MLDFKDLKRDKTTQASQVNIVDYSASHIAVVGVASRLAHASDTDEFWELLLQGKDCIRPLPAQRKNDVARWLGHTGRNSADIRFGEAAYMDEIDTFDYHFFRLSPKEASLMDPNQRLFLQVAWHALEDAGYSGGRLAGSRTGVYVGCGADSDYKRMITDFDPDSLSIATAGNVRPIIASRLSYILDFHGPSMLVDTTCSSSLASIHLACQAIRNGECDQAIAGGVQLHLFPFRETAIGVESSDHRAKTFSDDSDGTGTGEGVGAVLLKPLGRAIQDNDHIYGVIKGSAMNHDGNSIGLTAPNAAAQEDVITSAWEMAGIDPETISYMEAHGTGTKLGDPIEIDGIQRAFGKYTSRKNFCAIGAVKTNIGHLDNSAGIAGFLKCLLALKYKKLPPTLHFSSPNRKIDFIDSPVYVNDELADWESGQHPRRCGISSFGISGTNCHIVLEEAPETKPGAHSEERTEHVLALSAKTIDSLKQLVQDYVHYVQARPMMNLADLCYTANTGRDHHRYRIALVVDNQADLERLLLQLTDINWQDVRQGVYADKDGLVPNPETLPEDDRLAHAIRDLSADTIGRLYAQGTDMDWKTRYQQQRRNKLSVPVYPFAKTRCWVEPKTKASKKIASGMGKGPLLDHCLTESLDVHIYETEFRVQEHWVLSEHKIMGDCVLVGTTYLEMVLQACKERLGESVHFQDVLFLTPLIVGEDEARESQLVLKQEGQGYFFYVISRLVSAPEQKEPWIKHVEGKISGLTAEPQARLDIEHLKRSNNDQYLEPDMDEYNASSAFEFGPRWRNIEGMFIGRDTLITYLEMPEPFRGELRHYMLYPSLLDNALATMPLIRSALGPEDKSIFLPFSYKSMKVYRPLTPRMYSYVRVNVPITASSEMITYHITITDTDGTVLIDIEHYGLKKSQQRPPASAAKGHLFHTAQWVPHAALPGPQPSDQETVLVVHDDSGLARDTIKDLVNRGIRIVEVQFGERYIRPELDRYIIQGTEDDYVRLLQEAGEQSPITHLLYLSSLKDGEAASLHELEVSQLRGAHSLFYATKAVFKLNLKTPIKVLCVSPYVHEVTASESRIVPENATMFGLAKVINQEYATITAIAIDIDDEVTSEQIVSELLAEEADADGFAYRNGIRYVRELARMDMLEQVHQEEAVIRENGVYVITGGMGGIGLELARYLASLNRTTLVLMGRSPFPARETWKAITESKEDSKMAEKIHLIQEIEHSGSIVDHIQADIADERQLSDALQTVRDQYGCIHGVIHSAGLPGDGFIIRKDAELFRQVLSPKVQGTWLLHQYTKEDKLDFMILCSSNTTLIGLPGQGDYTAANYYLDSFAPYRNQMGHRTIALNWPAWKETGMAKDFGVNVDTFLKAISTELAIRAFGQVLHADIGNVHIGEINYDGSMQGQAIWEVPLRFSAPIREEVEKARAKAASKQKRGAGIQPGAAKGQTGSLKQVQEQIEVIWKEVLGFENVEADEHFFEIGGDSILITRVQQLIGAVYPGKVTVADLFTHATIADIAEFILSQSAEAEADHPSVISGQEEAADSIDLENSLLQLVQELKQGKISVNEAVTSYSGMGVSI